MFTYVPLAGLIGWPPKFFSSIPVLKTFFFGARSRRRYFSAAFQLTMVSEFMHKSPAKLILFSLCLPGIMLAPAFAQSVATDGRFDASPSSPAVSPAAYVPTAPPPPAASDSASYKLGPEDLLTVRVFAADDIPDKPVQIDNDGTITLPMIGKVQAAGLTVGQFQVNLVAAYKKYFKDPQVSVQVNEFHSQPVSVAGNVYTPGVVQLRGNRNLMEVISMAGGLRPEAGDSVLITRNLSEGAIPVTGAFTDPTGKYSVAHIDIRAVMSGKDPQGNIVIKPHDVITIPRARMIYVLGNVLKPGGFVLTENESMSISKAIALAGGWDKTAALSGARVLRASGGAEREQIPANVKKILKNQAPDLEMRPDDILYIPNSSGKTAGALGLSTAIGLGTGLAIWR
jgi:polysaccharide export outer membrane protein